LKSNGSAAPPLTIGLIVDDTLDKPDGVQQYVQILGRWLTQQGHEVHYIVGDSKRTDFPNVHSMSRNVRVKFNGNRLTVPLPASRRKIKALFAKTKFDVLHVMTPHSPFMAQRVICMAPKTTAVVSTFHILPHTRMVSALAKVLGLWLRPSLRRVQVHLAVSPVAQVFAGQAFHIQTRYLPNVLDVARFMQAEPLEEFADRPTIVRVDRLVPRKGAQHILPAIKYIVENQLYTKPFRVVIGGKGELYDTMQRYVADNNLGDIISLPGYVDEAVKPRYLASSDIALYPATGGESFGIVLIEAMAASKGPTLGGDNPGYRSVLGSHPDQLVDPTDTPKFARLIADYLNDAGKRKAAAAWQHEAVMQYDVNRVGAQLVDIYREALRYAAGVQ
jgi:phosphatidylinositol alpha-mannosyltransferase